REVRASQEGRAVRREEDGHRPATAARHADGGLHVERIHIGTLLAVHLDADELAIHDGCRALVLERFMRHDVTPMAGGVTDREQDWLILGARPRKRLVAPGIPIYRIV